MHWHFFTPTNTGMLILAFVVAWSLPWKAVALWKAARRKDLIWYIALLLINTVGILEIVYIYLFADRKNEK